MKIKNYVLMNQGKVERAMNGEVAGSGEQRGGVAKGVYLQKGKWMKEGEVLSKKEVESLENAILAEYDKLGGLIKNHEGDKVKTGSFYDFKGKKAWENPKVMLEFRINGELTVVAEDKPLPAKVRAAKTLENTKTKKNSKKAETEEESEDETEEETEEEETEEDIEEESEEDETEEDEEVEEDETEEEVEEENVPASKAEKPKRSNRISK